MSRTTIAAAAITAIALAAAAVWTIGAVTAPGPDVPTMTVRAAPFRVRVTAEGNLAAVNATPLGAPIKPQMPFTLAWIVEDGSVVAEGDVIARFDAAQLEKDRDDGLSDRRISDHRIGAAETGREVGVDKLDRDVEVSERELEVAREFQSTDSIVYSKMEIVESEIDAELAETRADHARDAQDIQDRLSGAEIELLSIERRKAAIRVEQAEEGLAALEVRSPHAGLVMLERDWQGNPVRVGDTVWPGEPLAKIPDLGEMQAEVFVLEADAGDLEPGLRATVWLEADPATSHPASLKSIDPMAGRRNRRVPVQYFRTVLALEQTDTATMKPGARVHAEITIADLESAITVPKQAVCSLEGKSVVYRWRRSGFEPAVVELGPAALGRVVVLSGLEDGDQMALRDPTAADEGGDEGDRPAGPVVPGGAS
ncbi:MAG: HlyD family efflux transporter periplasmic adaptor subunit [Thermoanaerobaculales bacterium]|nr:HlyD family efflux transporter periplasmic adaptor subunit [Thermoanaerobaculales bacterium]